MRNDPILMHYGVKGMKWRHRKGGVGAAEGISNNPNAGSTSTSTYTDRPKSKIRKDPTWYINLHAKRMSKLYNKGISYPKVTTEDVIEEEKLEEKKLKEKTLKEKTLKEKTLKEKTANGKVRSSNATTKGPKNDLIKKGLDGGAIKGSVAKKSAERVNTVSKGALKGMYNPKPKVSKEYEEEKNYNSKKNKYPEGMDPNQKSKIRKKKTR